MSVHWPSYWLGLLTPMILVLGAFLVAAVLETIGLLIESVMAERSTPMGVPVIECPTCGLMHPVTREHCAKCGRPSAFIGLSGQCLSCADEPIEVAR